MSAWTKMGRAAIQGITEGIPVGMGFARQTLMNRRDERTFNRQRDDKLKQGILEVAKAGDYKGAIDQAKAKGFTDLVSQIEGMLAGQRTTAETALGGEITGAKAAVSSLDLSSPDSISASRATVQQELEDLQAGRTLVHQFAGAEAPTAADEIIATLRTKINSMDEVSQRLAVLGPLGGDDPEHRKLIYDQIETYLRRAGVRDPSVFFSNLDRAGREARGVIYRQALQLVTDPTQARNLAAKYQVGQRDIDLGEIRAKSLELEMDRDITERQRLELVNARTLENSAIMQSSAGKEDKARETLLIAAGMYESAGDLDRAKLLRENPGAILAVNTLQNRATNLNDLRTMSTTAEGQKSIMGSFNTLYETQATKYASEMIPLILDKTYGTEIAPASAEAFKIDQTIRAWYSQHMVGIYGKPRQEAMSHLEKTMFELDKAEIAVAIPVLKELGLDFDPYLYRVTETGARTDIPAERIEMDRGKLAPTGGIQPFTPVWTYPKASDTPERP